MLRCQPGRNARNSREPEARRIVSYCNQRFTALQQNSIGIHMAIQVPAGYRLAGGFCGLKRNPTRQDLTLVVSDVPAVAAGVYTQNLVFAAPVALDRARTPGSGFRAVVVNSGNANACTGERGLADAREMARLAAATFGAAPEQRSSCRPA